jgi:hypothetical protein
VISQGNHILASRSTKTRWHKPRLKRGPPNGRQTGHLRAHVEGGSSEILEELTPHTSNATGWENKCQSYFSTCSRLPSLSCYDQGRRSESSRLPDQLSWALSWASVSFFHLLLLLAQTLPSSALPLPLMASPSCQPGVDTTRRRFRLAGLSDDADLRGDTGGDTAADLSASLAGLTILPTADSSFASFKMVGGALPRPLSASGPRTRGPRSAISGSFSVSSGLTEPPSLRSAPAASRSGGDLGGGGGVPLQTGTHSAGEVSQKLNYYLSTRA